MTKRYKLSDSFWEMIEDLITQDLKTGSPRHDDPLMLNGVPGCSVLALLGAICLSALAHGRRFISASVIGAIAERLTRCSSGFTSNSTSKG